MNSVTIPDVIYGHKCGMALILDILKPEKPSGIGILALSSGGWASWPDAGKPETAAFLDRGLTVFVVMHGGRPRFGIPEIVQDIQRATRFIRVHGPGHGIDPRRLGIFGGSSGGNISLLTAAQGDDGKPEAEDPLDRQSTRLDAVACFYPPADFRNYGEPGKIWIPYRTPEETRDDAEVAAAYSPITHFTSAMPPTLIIHGTADTAVPIQQGRTAIQRLSELGVEHRFEERPGKEHGWPDMSAEYALCADWFVTHLGR